MTGQATSTRRAAKLGELRGGRPLGYWGGNGRGLGVGPWAEALVWIDISGEETPICHEWEGRKGEMGRGKHPETSQSITRRVFTILFNASPRPPVAGDPHLFPPALSGMVT